MLKNRQWTDRVFRLRYLYTRAREIRRRSIAAERWDDAYQQFLRLQRLENQMRAAWRHPEQREGEHFAFNTTKDVTLTAQHTDNRPYRIGEQAFYFDCYPIPPEMGYHPVFIAGPGGR